MAILKYKDSFDEMLEYLDRDWFRPVQSWTWHGKIYDPEKYDLVPKSSYVKELIDKKEKRIAELDEQKKQLKDEIEKLKSG